MAPQDLRTGERVEVYITWAGGESPSKSWFGGYTYCYAEADNVHLMLKRETGTFKGMKVRYHKDLVRRERK